MELSGNMESFVRSIATSAESGRSYFLYNLTAMKMKIASLRYLVPSSVEIFYAMKANPHASFLEAARAGGADGVEIASLGEGRKALAAGFSPQQLVFTGPGKSPEELEWAVATGIRFVHIESLVEAYRLQAICARLGQVQNILVRVNPNFHVHGAQANFSGDSSKFGIDQSSFIPSLLEIIALGHLRLKGLHVYSASGVLAEDDLLDNCRRVFELARDAEAANREARCDVIDFGGGFGIDYTESGRSFSPEIYSLGLQRLIDEFGFHDRKFVLELGRYLAADSGWYCSEILDIKSSLGVKQIVCQGGSHHFRRPVALKIAHPVAIVAMGIPPLFAGQEEVVEETAFIGGSLCNSADKLAPEPILLKHARVGDVLVVGLAGAYGFSMSHLDFLSHQRPAEIVFDL